MNNNPNLGGQCADDSDHPRRCQGKSRATKKRCRRWALKNKRFCAFHGGRHSSRPVRIDHLPKFYSSQLSDTLAERVQEMLSGAPAEQLRLYEELALVRLTAQDAVQLYDIAHKEGADIEARMTAGVILREILGDVVKTCEAAAKVEATARDKVSVHNLQFILNQVVRIAYELFEPDNHELAVEFEKSIRVNVRMPDEIQGTSVTPDMDVNEMDLSVPGDEQ